MDPQIKLKHHYFYEMPLSPTLTEYCRLHQTNKCEISFKISRLQDSQLYIGIK